MLIKHNGKLISSIGEFMNQDQLEQFLNDNEIDIPVSELTIEYSSVEIYQIRKSAYARYSDPLYMEWQYDQTDASKQAWQDKVAEIKARYPFPA